MEKRIGSRVLAAVCCVLCAAMLFACAQSTAAQTQPLDPLTGQAAQYEGQRAVAIPIENSASSTTQWGLSSASVVLEALTASGADTSLCLVYPSVEAVPKAGPVAAGQDLYWRLLSGQQVLPVQRGGSTYDRNYLEYYNITAVDALEVGRNAFSCQKAWANAPLWYTSGTALSRVLSGLNASASLSPAGKTVLTQTDEDGNQQLSVHALLPFRENARLPEASATDAAHVWLRFDAANQTGFDYNASLGAYTMLHADGTPQYDANTNEQAAFDNLLILYSASTVRDDGATLDYDLTLGGGAWLHGGELRYITWQQGSETTFTLYDEDGRQLSLTPGRSYIALITSLTGEELSVTNSEGESLT